MTTEVPPADDDLRQDSPIRRVDAACDRFEAAWRGGQDPRIEDFLDAAAEPERPALLRELITLDVELRRGRGEHPTPGEYHKRFPGQPAAVGAAIVETAAGPGDCWPRPSQSRVDTGRNLLFGILALQNNFIGRNDLLAAFAAWVGDKARPLAQFLVDRGALDDARRALLEALVAEHLKQHGDDPKKSLAVLSSIGSVRDDLSHVADPEVQESLSHVSVARTNDDRDPDRTVIPPSVGDSTSAGTRYRILHPHAKGGLGEVFVARDTELNREVAVKEIQAQFAFEPRFCSRFEFEAEVTGGLEHPGIVPVYGLGHLPDGRPFYAMRFIRGGSLKEAVRRFHEAEKQPGRDSGESALALRELLGRFIDVCDAVAYAHSRGVLHRDLKPGNIMLGRYGETLVVDWGLAKAIDRPEVRSAQSAEPEPLLRPSSGSQLEPTQAGSAVGTPGYMSPEQVDNRLGDLGVCSDVYCLGATLYHLLTGHAPCEADQIAEVYRKVMAGDIPRPRSLNTRIVPALEAICLKALSLKPEGRYRSAEALKADVERWLADEPVSAWREPLADRVRRWGRRHQGLVTASIAAGLVASVALLAITTVITITNRGLQAANQTIRQNDEKIGRQNQQLEESNKNLKLAHAEARAEADKAKAINDFLTQDLLEQAEPANNAPEDRVTLLEVLDRAAEKVGTRFAGAPDVADAVRRTIARTYHGLGSWEKAQQHWQAVLESSRRRIGPETHEALTALDGLAHILYHRGRVDAEVIGMAKSASEGLARVVGPDHPNTLTSLSNLAPVYLAAGSTAQAIKLFEATLRQSESSLGADHPDTLISGSNLARAYRDDGRMAEAIQLLEGTLKRSESTLGLDHPHTLLMRHELARAYTAVGRIAEAIALHEQTLKLRESKLGRDHEDTLRSRNGLAVAYQDGGRTARAIALLEETLGLEESKLGGDNLDTLTTMANLGIGYCDAGRRDEGIRLMEKSLDMARTRYGSTPTSLAFALPHLAYAYDQAERFAEADSFYRNALEQARSSFGPGDPRTAGAMAGLGYHFLKKKSWAEAEAVLRECLAIREQSLPHDWSTFNTRSMLGGSLLGQKRYVEAEPLLISGYEGMKAREATLPPRGKARLSEAAERVVGLYEAWGKPEKVAEWNAKLGLLDLPASVFAQP